jgi:hypothetical protein
MKAKIAGVDEGTENEYETDKGKGGQCKNDDQIEGCGWGEGQIEVENVGEMGKEFGGWWWLLMKK